jgi:putative spermidine/putrescine transport system substrate-binding protein
MITRRTVIGGMGAAAAGAALPGMARAALPLPKHAVDLTIVDVAGNLALTQKAIESYRRAKPGVVSGFAFTKAPAPELPPKISAMQQAGVMNIDLVLTGTDALSAGLSQNLWLDLAPYLPDLPNLQQIYIPQAWKMQAIAQSHGVVVTYYPSGPLIEYMPAAVKTVPGTAQDLLDWAKQNNNKFMYARPANSGPGRTWLMGLPYILGDRDPHDPVQGWDKTWGYLQEIGKYIEYYPGGTTQTMRELGEGTRDVIATTTGWDINPRVLGIVPAEAKVGMLANFHWVTDAHYMVIPKGVSPDKIAVLIDLMNFMLQDKQQAYAYDQGYFYPGPAVAGVTLAMAPQDSQDAIKTYGRPEYDQWIAEYPKEIPLDAQKMVTAFDMWDKRVGAQKA